MPVASRANGKYSIIRYRAARRNESWKVVENRAVTVWFDGKKVPNGTQFGEPKSVFTRSDSVTPRISIRSGISRNER